MTDWKNHTKFFNKKHQPIGDLVDGIFYKKIQGSKHIMQIYNALGIDEEVLQKITQAKEIRILDTETNTIYVTVPKNFTEKGIRKNFDTPQVFLPIKYFEKEDSKQEKLL